MRTPQLDIYLNERREEYLVSVGYSSVDGRRQMNNPAYVYCFMRDNYIAHRRSKESVWLLSLDSKMRLIGSFELTVGTNNMSICDVREVYKAALMSGATNIVLIHNHPSGDVTPSNEDEVTTERLIAVGRLLNLPLADHIIIGNNNFYSFHSERNELFN